MSESEREFEAEFTRRSALAHALAMAPCLQDHFLEMRETAEASLIRHLPDLRPEDRDWVELDQIQALAAALRPDAPVLTLALLEALAQVGDSLVIRKVEALHREIAEQPGAQAVRLRMATTDCLNCLRQEAARARQSRTLLRGSESPEEQAQSILLRPARASGPTESDELMRAEPDPLRRRKEGEER